MARDRVCPATQGSQDAFQASHAGSWRKFPDQQRRWWWRAGLPPAFERLDDDHVTAAARAWWAMVLNFLRFVIRRWRDIEQLAGEREAGFA